MTPTEHEHRSIAVNLLRVPPAAYDAMRATLDASREGQQAALDGLPITANPFITPTDTEHGAWAVGYARAHTERTTA